MITAGWIPLGLLVLFAANWCPDKGTADAVAVLSLTYVAVQLVGNAVAGWLLDRRYGNRCGTMLCIGRSVLVAVVLMVVLGILVGIIVPDGQSVDCG